MGPSRRRFVVLAVALGTVMSTFVAGGQPTAAQAGDTPTVAVTPDRVADGETVTITTSGFPAGLHVFVQCRASARDAGANQFVWDHCRLLGGILPGVPAPTLPATVERRFTPPGWPGGGTQPTPVDCDTEPGGCLVGVSVLPDDGSGEISVWAEISFVPPLLAQPGRNLADDDTVAVSATEIPEGEWSVSQCVPDDAIPIGSRCGAPTPVVLDGDTVAGDVVVHDPLVAADGTQHPCGYAGCELVLSAVDQPGLVTAISFGPPSIAWAILGPGGLGQQSSVQVTLAGMPGTTATVRQCALPASASTCDIAPAMTLDRFGGRVIPSRTVPSLFTAADGTPIDCSVTPCSLVAESDGESVTSDPLPLPPPTRMAISPADGLVDGDPITVDVTGLTPGVLYRLAQCSGPRTYYCPSITEVTADAKGAVSVTVPAVHRFGNHTYCRAQCVVTVWSDIGPIDAVYSMAPGAASVSPSDGLADGQTVPIAATDMQPTYPGRAFGPFLSGVAVAAQCSVSFEQSPNLFTYFDGCGTTAIPLTITDPEFEVGLPVHTTITTFTGRQVDCTTAGACVAGVARFDQDGSMTPTMTSLAFDG